MACLADVASTGVRWMIFYNMLLLTLRVARSCQPQPLSLSAAEC